MASMLKIISERAGVSQAAVSQILNRRLNDYSSKETKKRVFSIARELGYKQKFGHKLLRGEKTKTVAIVLSMQRLILEEQNQHLVLLLLDKFERAGYVTYLQPIAGDEEKNLKIVRELILRGTDHFVWIGNPTGVKIIEKEILSNGRSVIGFGSGFQRNVQNDNLHSIDVTLRNFLHEGRSNFRLLIGAPNQVDRVQVVCDLLPDLSYNEVICRHIVFLNFNDEVDSIDELTAMGYEKTHEIMAADPTVSALMYLSDYFMLGGIRYLHQNHYTIGRDVVLCGHNNIHAVRNHIFPLSTWEIDMEKISSILFQECAGTGKLQKLIPSKHITTKGDE
jgi:DNA-binding LacI/PurR family transcriptional regulator